KSTLWPSDLRRKAAADRSTRQTRKAIQPTPRGEPRPARILAKRGARKVMPRFPPSPVSAGAADSSRETRVGGVAFSADSRHSPTAVLISFVRSVQRGFRSDAFLDCTLRSRYE